MRGEQVADDSADCAAWGTAWDFDGGDFGDGAWCGGGGAVDAGGGGEVESGFACFDDGSVFACGSELYASGVPYL